MDIRRILKEKDITLKELSYMMNVHYITVHRFVKGYERISVKNTKKLAEILGVNWWELYDSLEKN